MVDLDDAYVRAWVPAVGIAVGINVWLGAAMGTYMHLIGNCVAGTAIVYWFVYSLKRVEKEKTPDDYMIAFIYMWADMLTCFAMCLCVACMQGEVGVATTQR